MIKGIITRESLKNQVTKNSHDDSEIIQELAIPFEKLNSTQKHAVLSLIYKNLVSKKTSQ